MNTEQELKQIQYMVSQGTITESEARLLRDALAGSPPEPDLESPSGFPNRDGREIQSISYDSDIHHYWLIPTSIGAAVILLGSGLMHLAWSARGFGFLFVLSWIPFILGLSVLILGWRSRTGPWLQINIEQPQGENPERIPLKIPLPLRFVGWILKIIDRWIPNDSLLKKENLIKTLVESISEQLPIEILVNDTETGERVELVIA
jgi:hypothetical protein